MLWEVLNKDWIEDQIQRNKHKKETKKRKRKSVKSSNIIAKTPSEAIKNSSKLVRT